MSSVSLRSVVCLIDRFPALTDVNLEVSEGEVVLLSGGNGAGKTTLLRLIAGLVPAFSGEVIVLGKNLRINCRAHRRITSYNVCYTSYYARPSASRPAWGSSSNKSRGETANALAIESLRRS